MIELLEVKSTEIGEQANLKAVAESNQREKQQIEHTTPQPCPCLPCLS